MTRHSKNNTSLGVFTYGEKKMLKDWGVQKTRLGKDSHKAFELCVLCLSRVNSPVCCEKGHLFCKECIIENLIQQKKEQEREMESWEREQYEKELIMKKNKQQELTEKIQKFEKQETQPKEDLVDREKLALDLMDDDERAKVLVAKSRLNKDFNKEERKDWVKVSFWRHDPSGKVEKKEKEKPIKKLICPSHESDDHHIKMKNLINLNLTDQKEKNSFVHFVNKILAHQKIGALRKCGHVMCLECINKYCLPDESCSECSERLKKKDIIQLKESGTAFAAHNEVEAKSYTPAFNG